MPCPRLYLNHNAAVDWLIALEFGRVDDGQPTEWWEAVSEDFGYLRDGHDGPIIGFKVIDFSEFDLDAEEVARIWSGPRFDAPVLGLTSCTAGEIVLAARALFGGNSSINRVFFSEAIDAEGEEALDLWLACLQAGDSMAHFAVGYTLYDLGRFQEAYRHLRHYTEISPAEAWNWCWLGRAAEAIGEFDEARAAYQRAITLDVVEEDEDKTDADELLAALESRQEAA